VIHYREKAWIKVISEIKIGSAKRRLIRETLPLRERGRESELNSVKLGIELDDKKLDGCDGGVKVNLDG